MKPIGVALIGYGGIGAVHAMAYRTIPFHYGYDADHIKIVGVATSSKESAQRAAAKIGCSVFTDRYQELIARDDVDIVDCTLPNHLHAEVVIAAAAAGKHIYCEKPLALNVAEAQEMVSAVQAAHVKNQVSFNFRFYPAIVRAYQLIQAGKLGRIFSFYGRYYRSSYITNEKPLTWRLKKEYGGGALTDIGSHAIDLIYYLLGDLSAVNATLTTLIDERPHIDGSGMGKVTVDDLAHIQLKTARGEMGFIEASRMGTGTVNDLRIEIYGQNGALRFDAQNPSWLEFFSTEDVAEPLGGMRGFRRLQTVQRYEGQKSPDWTMPAAFVRTHAECQHQFIRSVIEDTEATPSILDGMRVQAVLDTAVRSSELGRWVAIQHE